MPVLPQYNTIDTELLINGENKHLHTAVESISVEYEVNKIPFAQIKLATDNHIRNNRREVEGAVLLDDEIEIRIREGGEMKTLFKGLIISIKKTISPSALHLVLECKDLTSKLLLNQEVIPDESFGDKFDRFLNHHSIDYGVELKSFGEEQISIIDREQPWDFILSYLDALGYLTTIKEGEFTAVQVTEQEEASLELHFGINIFELDYLKTRRVASVAVEYWDISDQEIKAEEAETGLDPSEGKEVIDLGQTGLGTETISQIAKALAARNRIASFSGHIRTFGNLQANYGEHLRLVDAGEDFEGRSLLITAEHHNIDQQGWTTSYTFGLENDQLYAESIPTIQSTRKDQLSRLNSISGLQVGIVTNLEGDPQGQFRIQVQIPAISNSGDGYWARIASLQAGENRGAWFIPEPGDEVVVGFFNDNPDSPVILGKLYSDAKSAPFELTADNFFQGIVTREGSQLVFDDQKKSIKMNSPGGNTILISDDESGIILQDQNGNKIQMDSSGIHIESAGDINFKSTMNTNIEGVQNSIKASGVMKIEGSLIQLN